MRGRGFVCMVLVLLLMFCANSPPLMAVTTGKPAITITVDGKAVRTEVPPIISKGRTLVPLRAVGEALNLQVNWSPTSQTIDLTGDGLNLELMIGAQTARLNNEVLSMEVPPILINGHTMVPLRFIGEAVGCSVSWNAEEQQVSITSPAVPLELLAYYALGTSENSSWTDLFNTAYPETARGNTDVVDTIALGWYTLDENGVLSTSSDTGWQQPDGWENVLTAIKQYGLKTQMTIHMTDKDGRIIQLLNNQAAQDAAIASITREAGLYDGINIDLEGLGWNDTDADLLKTRELFSGFIDRLSASLHQNGKTVALSLHPANSAYKGYDYQSLGLAADKIIVMAYDYGPKPEPMDRVKQAIDMALAAVPKEKLLLGISVPSENPASVAEKIGLATSSRIAGVALWRLGIVSDEMWTQIRNCPGVK